MKYIQIWDIDKNRLVVIDLKDFIPMKDDVLQTSKTSYKVLYRNFYSESYTLRLFVREEK